MLTILVVDDSPVDRQLAVGIVEQLGSTAITAENGLEALKRIEEDKPDVVLTDLLMPELDGLKLVERIRDDHLDVPVVLMTAFGSEDTAAAALRAGAASYVPKRNLKPELDEALRTVMSAVEARQQKERVRSFLESIESHFVLTCEPESTTALVSYLQDGLSQLGICDDAGLFQVSTALAEALANAFDHGNLELDSALRETSDFAYGKLREERRTQIPYRDRKVHVTATLTPEEAKYVVRDEGDGFDPAMLPDPKDPENLLKPYGRGIMLIRTFMDEVEFNDRGNEITMIKRVGHDP